MQILLIRNKKRKKGLIDFCVCLRLLSTKAAAITAMITTAAAMAMYVVVGTPPAGVGATLGEEDQKDE
jgi:hypothetical protein